MADTNGKKENWLTALRPKISRVFQTEQRDTPDNLWHKCPNCGQMLFHRDLEAAYNVCSHCGHHMRLGAQKRLESVFDGQSFKPLTLPDVAADPLKFRDQKKYSDRLRDARTKTGLQDAIVAGSGTIDKVPLTALAQDFSFMGGSMGMATGEAIITAARHAVDHKTAFVIFAASGGARMQEGILSLMQLPRSTVAVQEVKEAGLPYIVVQTDPTTGGVSASYAMLGDIHISEPNAQIGFAGARVIEQTIREKLPEGFQRAEYLLEHGMIDMVVRRSEMRSTLSRIIRHLMNKGEAPNGSHAEPDLFTASGPAKPLPEPPPASASTP